METYKLFILCAVLISAVILRQSASAKPFSINRALAAKNTESGTELSEADTEKVLVEDLGQNFPRTQFLRKEKGYNLTKKNKQLQSQNSLISKPNKLKLKSLHTPINKSKTKSLKRAKEVDYKYGSKLLNNIRHLFDDILNAHSIGLFNEINPDESIQNDYRDDELATDKTNVAICKCAFDGQPSTGNQKQDETTITSTAPTSSKITSHHQDSKTTASRTDYSSSGDISRVRQNTLLPLLSARNTFSDGGNDYGFGKRSSSTFHPNLERNISGNNRISEYDTESERFTFNAESHEEDSDGPSRDRSSSDGQNKPLRGTGNSSRFTEVRSKTNSTQNATNYSETYEKDSDILSGEYPSSSRRTRRLRLGNYFRDADIRTSRNSIKSENDETESSRNDRTEFQQHQVQNKSQIEGNNTEHIEFFPWTNQQRVRGPAFYLKNNIRSKFNQSEEVNEEGITCIKEYSTSHQRITDGNVSIATENKSVFSSNEKMIGGISRYIFPAEKINNNAKVIITDGYSIMRSTNDNNNPSEKVKIID